MSGIASIYGACWAAYAEVAPAGAARNCWVVPGYLHPVLR